jgi:hypothetical protein
LAATNQNIPSVEHGTSLMYLGRRATWHPTSASFCEVDRKPMIENWKPSLIQIQLSIQPYVTTCLVKVFSERAYSNRCIIRNPFFVGARMCVARVDR